MSREIFMREGGDYLINAVDIMNAVALMKETHGDFYGALQAAEKSMRSISHLGASPNRKADEIRLQSRIIIGNIRCRLTHYGEAEQVFGKIREDSGITKE